MTNPTTPPRSPIFLAQGSHSSPEAGMCAMEFAAYLAGEPHSDHPSCVSRVITRDMIRKNDSLPDDLRQQLLPLTLEVLGTNTGRVEDEIRRSYMAADYAVRTVLPWMLQKFVELLPGWIALIRRMIAVGKLDDVVPVPERAALVAAGVA